MNETKEPTITTTSNVRVTVGTDAEGAFLRMRANDVVLQARLSQPDAYGISNALAAAFAPAPPEPADALTYEPPEKLPSGVLFTESDADARGLSLKDYAAWSFIHSRLHRRAQAEAHVMARDACVKFVADLRNALEGHVGAQVLSCIRQEGTAVDLPWRVGEDNRIVFRVREGGTRPVLCAVIKRRPPGSEREVTEDGFDILLRELIDILAHAETGRV